MMLVLLFLFVGTCVCQWNQSVYEALKTYSPVLYAHIHSTAATEIIDVLNQRQHNVTFLVPIEAVLNSTIETGLLNVSVPSTYNRLSAMILNGSFTNGMFLENRQFYKTLFNNSISIGPQIVNNKQTPNIEIYSGLTKAMTTASGVQCLNGIIQYVDNFLQPAETPLDTISTLSQTEYMEGLLKSLNVSNVISGTNKTVLVPVNEAWEAVNGSTLPYGTLVHNLRYSVIDGVYTLDKILAAIDPSTNTTALTTDYRKQQVHLRLENQQLKINDVAKFVQTDILTTYGVIHLVDTVLSSDTLEAENNTASPVSGTDTSASPLDHKYSSASTLRHLNTLIVIPLILLIL